MKIKFTRDGETVKEGELFNLEELPSINETITLPGSKRKHKVVMVLKKYHLVRETRLRVREIEVVLGPAPKGR